jgi:hypothetical protein
MQKKLGKWDWLSTRMLCELHSSLVRVHVSVIGGPCHERQWSKLLQPLLLSCFWNPKLNKIADGAVLFESCSIQSHDIFLSRMGKETTPTNDARGMVASDDKDYHGGKWGSRGR